MLTPDDAALLMSFPNSLRKRARSLVVVAILVLIPTSEGLRASATKVSPFFYRCDNGQTLVWRPEYASSKGTIVSIYPFPVEERSRVLWRLPARYAEGRHSARYFISDNGLEYDCKPWRRGDNGDAGVWGIPDPPALKEYAKRFNTAGKYRHICEGGHTVLFRITDFWDAGYRHGVMELNDQGVVGLFHSRGTSGNFSSKALSDRGISFAWGVHLDDEKRSVIKRYLNIDEEVFACNRGGY